VFKAAGEQVNKKALTFYIQDGIYNKEIAAILFFKEVYLPNEQINILVSGKISNNSLVLADPNFLTNPDKHQLKELTPMIGFYKLYIKED
jgi:hypothetical protein